MSGGRGSTPQRIVRRAEARAQGRREAIARAAEGLGIAASIEGERVVLEGRGLRARWMRDARLRDIGRDA